MPLPNNDPVFRAAEPGAFDKFHLIKKSLFFAALDTKTATTNGLLAITDQCREAGALKSRLDTGECIYGLCESIHFFEPESPGFVVGFAAIPFGKDLPVAVFSVNDMLGVIDLHAGIESLEKEEARGTDANSHNCDESAARIPP
jgi:hypothetical protein